MKRLLAVIALVMLAGCEGQSPTVEVTQEPEVVRHFIALNSYFSDADHRLHFIEPGGYSKGEEWMTVKKWHRCNPPTDKKRRTAGLNNDIYGRDSK